MNKFCLKLILSTLVILVFPKVHAQKDSGSPYALFGDNTPVLDSSYSNNNQNWTLVILMPDSSYACVEIKDKTLTVKDSNGNILTSQTINPTGYARFTTVDPHAVNYFNLSPYAYCGGDPVNRTDPDGRDWYQNNETSYYTWYEGDEEREGFTYIGKAGSLLGDFEPLINNILIDVYKNNNGLYSEGRIVDITNPNKGAILPSQFSKLDDFLDEFVFGYGPEISILTDNHPYTKALQTDDVVLESQMKLRIGDTDIPGQITKVNKSWSILDAISTTSIAKQFVGSYSFDSYTSNDNNHLLNIIYDTKNVRSLFYHIPGTGYLNHSRKSVVKPLANTYQFYIWQSKK